jgi:cyanophycin synthetase
MKKSMGKYVAEAFDEIIIRHDKDSRGRTNEELTGLITEGIKSVKPYEQPLVISDEVEALEYAIQHAGMGAFIVDSTEEIQDSTAFVMKHMEEQENIASQLI